MVEIAIQRQGASVRLSILMVALILAGCATSQTEYASSPTTGRWSPPLSVPASSSAMRELTLSERAILADAFSASLNEPQSVKFKWTKIPAIAGRDRRSIDYCAQLDAKNDSGAYRGMQPFLATVVIENGIVRGGAIAALSSEVSSQNRAIIPRLCEQKGLDPFG
ncbi:hypothetical protein [Bradyrhizobium sp. USDA 4502]